MEKIKSRDIHKGILAAGLLLLGISAYADPPAPARTPAQNAFETFVGSTVVRSTAPGAAPVRNYSFYSQFNSTANPELGQFANHLALQLVPGNTPAILAQRADLAASLLERFQGLAGVGYTSNTRRQEQYALAALMYALGRPAGDAPYPIYLLPVRTSEESDRARQDIIRFYHFAVDAWFPVSPQNSAAVNAENTASRNTWKNERPPLAATNFIHELTRGIHFANNTDPATGGYYATMAPLDGGRTQPPLAQLFPFAAGRPVAHPEGAGDNPFVRTHPAPPPPPPPPVPVLTTSHSGTPVLNFSRMAESSSSYTWRNVPAPGGRTQRVLYHAQPGGASVEVGRVWSQGGFTYLNYTGPGGSSQQYGHLYPLGAGGALPTGQITALPPGIDYSSVRPQAVRDVLGGTRQVVLLPAGNGRYQDLAGNPYETAARQEQVYYACGWRGRRTCVGYQSSSEIRPVDPGSAPHAALAMPTAGAPAAAGHFSVVTSAQPNEWGARRIVHRNGHPVGYVIQVGGQDVIFVGSPTSHRWAIYAMDGTPITLNFSGQAIITRTFGGRSVGLIPVGGRRYVDVAGRRFEVNGNAVRRVDL